MGLGKTLMHDCDVTLGKVIELGGKLLPINTQGKGKERVAIPVC